MPYNWSEDGFGEGPYGGEGPLPAGDNSPSIATVDHVALGLSRVIKQYQESPKLLAYLSATLALSNQLETTFHSLLALPDIDAMLGVNLDTIGAIVGQGRALTDAIQLTFFGFSDDIAAANFGEETVRSIGSRFYEEGTSYLATNILEDPEYKVLIRARIIKNNSVSTPESIMASLSYLFSTPIVGIRDTGGMVISLSIGRSLSLIEKIIVRKLDLLPRPMGVRISGIVTYDVSRYFGFADQPQALGFSEESTPNQAFLAEEF